MIIHPSSSQTPCHAVISHDHNTHKVYTSMKTPTNAISNPTSCAAQQTHHTNNPRPSSSFPHLTSPTRLARKRRQFNNSPGIPFNPILQITCTCERRNGKGKGKGKDAVRLILVANLSEGMSERRTPALAGGKGREQSVDLAL
jgi:hypothetical protein